LDTYGYAYATFHQNRTYRLRDIAEQADKPKHVIATWYLLGNHRGIELKLLKLAMDNFIGFLHIIDIMYV
jgi:hypothetical protein